VAGTCEHGDEPSSSIKCRGTFGFSRTLLHGIGVSWLLLDRTVTVPCQAKISNIILCSLVCSVLSVNSKYNLPI
jgi:hypothetical protein